MNNVQLVGRLTRDPEVRYLDNGSTVTRFTLAVDRRIKREGGENADFISCVAFGKTAEFLEKWFFKGQRLGLTGRIQTGSYTNQEGKKVYTTDVVVDTAEFVESRSGSSKQGDRQAQSQGKDIGDGFMDIPDDVEDEELPFN